jgi:uncharacterized protein
MIDRILSIEQTSKVKVLYACESGSRAWGLASKESDYDIRFIYIHPLEWYLDIDQKRDVIEHPITDSLDMSGWDLQKALMLLRKSNPPLLEWLHSDITYFEHGSFLREIQALAVKAFSTKACLFHYLSMAKRNFKDITQKDQVKVKKYFNVLRPMIACKWIEENNRFPATNFPLLVKKMITDEQLRDEIEKLIKLKIIGQEYISLQSVSLIHAYLQDEIIHLENYAKTLPNTKSDVTEELNFFFQKTLKEVWGLPF